MSVSGVPRNSLLWIHLFSVYILWGSTYLFIHFMTEDMPPIYMAGCRLLLAGMILYPAARLSGYAHPSRKEWMSAGIIGILLLTISNGGMTIALQYIPSGIAALLAGLLPLFIIVLNWVGFTKVKPTKMILTGLLLGIIGIMLLVRPGSFKETSSQSWIGITIILFTNLSWATGTLLSSRLALPRQLISSAAQMLVGGGMQFVVALIFEPVTFFSILDAPPKALGAMVYLVIFGSILGFSSYAWLARNAPAHIVSTHAFVNPIVAVLLGYIFAGEIYNLQAIWAALIIVAGVGLITLSKKRA
jgi:drug/metabolite transporter (DMT)-like permease